MTDPFQVISKIAYLFPRCIVFFSISPLEQKFLCGGSLASMHHSP
jgi:hypothetical protein